MTAARSYGCPSTRACSPLRPTPGFSAARPPQGWSGKGERRDAQGILADASCLRGSPALRPRRGNQPVYRPAGQYACSRGGTGARFPAPGPGGRDGPGTECPGASCRRTGRLCPCRLDARAWCRRPASAPRPVSGRAGRRHLCRAGRGRYGGAAARGGLCRLARGSSRGICSSGMRGITHVYRNRDGRCHCDHRCYHLGPAEIAHPQ